MGESGVTSRKKKQKISRFFFWTFGSTSTETDRANVRHKRPPFSTKLFTHVIKLDPAALMGPKGKRNRQGALPVLLHGPRRAPGTPGYPPVACQCQEFLLEFRDRAGADFG